MRSLQILLRSAVVASCLCVTTANSKSELEADVRCLSNADQAIRLEWHTFSDADSGWFGGYVKYSGATQVIPIVLASTQTLSQPGDRPWDF